MRDEWGTLEKEEKKRVSRADKQFAEAAQRPIYLNCEMFQDYSKSEAEWEG
jgi:hypothetical protein